MVGVLPSPHARALLMDPVRAPGNNTSRFNATASDAATAATLPQATSAARRLRRSYALVAMVARLLGAFSLYLACRRARNALFHAAALLCQSEAGMSCIRGEPGTCVSSKARPRPSRLEQPQNARTGRTSIAREPPSARPFTPP